MKAARIHQQIAGRLALVWGILSVVIGGVVFYLEMRKADDLVLRLMIAESENFTAQFNRLDAERIFVLRRKAEELLERRHFILIQLYDRDGQEILRASAPRARAIEAELQRQLRRFPRNDAVQHHAVFVQRRLLMHILLPLKELDGSPAGYFEGMYQMDDETIANIRNDVLGALALVVLVTLATTLALYPVIVALNRGLIRHARDLLKGNVELMQVLGSAVALRDSDTGTHNHRVTLYAVRLGQAHGLGRAPMRRLIAGAFLHDVGKIGVNDAILLKHGRHSEEETCVMRTHVPLGVAILGKSEWLQHAREVVESHHEKYDGTGYPYGLKGEEIPLNARIFAIVDVFDALVSRRPYKEPFGFEEAMQMLARERGRHFDPALLDAFERIASTAYAEINGADEALVVRALDEVVARYFSD